MKRLVFALLFVLGLSVDPIFAQGVHIYDPQANATEQIAEAVKKAHAEGKSVFLQIGGNWCPWCVKFHGFCDNTPEIHQLMEKDYVRVMVNYSKENKNLDVLAKLGYPQRFGFPVLVILNDKGERIHTQNSAYLEEDGGYSIKKVAGFLKNWGPDALNPAHYASK
jgi:thioredoxin-related protein